MIHVARFFSYSLFSLVVCTPVSVSYGQAAPGNSKGHMHFEGLNSAVERMMDSVGIPGLSLAVIENNRIVYFHPYGRKNDGTGHKVDKRTVFEACSLSKNFLSYVAHQLVDEGKLDVQKPVYEYLPNDRLEHDARYKLITAHEILAHCSGIENWQVFNNPDTLEIVSNPGEKFVYSGEAFNYLAQIIAKILGQPYEEYMTERVTRPLHLHDTYFRFTKQTSGSAVKVHPADFATPTYTFGNTGYKWINTEPLPSSAVNVNARDYARLLIALFNYRHLSAAETRKLWQPVVKVNAHDTTLFIGEGFEISYAGKDTIINHEGDNPGFKSAVFYSVVSKKGFAFFANSDRGMLIADRLNKLTVNLDIRNILAPEYYRQYPNTAIMLFKVFRDSGEKAMFGVIDSLERTGRLDEATLDQLGDESMDYGLISRRIVDMDVRMYPNASLGHQLKGELFMNMNELDSAIACLTEARRLDTVNPVIETELAYCRKNLNPGELQRRRSMLTKVDPSVETVIQGKNYSSMYSAVTERTGDSANQDTSCYISKGHWVDFVLSVPAGGVYKLGVRVKAREEGTMLELSDGPGVTSAFPVPSTKETGWTLVNTEIPLTGGIQVLRICAAQGAVSINRIELDHSL